MVVAGLFATDNRWPTGGGEISKYRIFLISDRPTDDPETAVDVVVVAAVVFIVVVAKEVPSPEEISVSSNR